MSTFWMAIGEWWVHAAVAGGLVLLLGYLGIRCSQEPIRRQRLAAWTVRGAVLAAVLSALPSWLLMPAPSWAILPQPTPPEPEPSVAQSVGPLGRVHVKPDQYSLVELPTEQSEIWRPLVLAESLQQANVVFLTVDAAENSAIIPEVPSPPSVPTVEAPLVVQVPLEEQTDRVVPLLVLAYLATAGLLLLQLVLGHVLLLRIVWFARPISGKARWVYDRVSEQLGVRPLTLVSDRIASPICFGLLRPVVLLPRRLAESADEHQLRWVLAHEFDHVQRGDHHSAYWVGMVRAVFFFVPWFWPVRKELNLSQEFLADAAAAEVGGQTADYAAFLVQLSGSPLERRLARPSLASTGVRAGQSDLFRRVNMLLNWNSKLERRVPKGFAIVAAGGVLATAVGLSGLGFQLKRPLRPKWASSSMKNHRHRHRHRQPVRHALHQFQPKFKNSENSRHSKPSWKWQFRMASSTRPRHY
jgi:beta-lactamase regulating signal transducer with metallopeptidase domain